MRCFHCFHRSRPTGVLGLPRRCQLRLIRPSLLLSECAKLISSAFELELRIGNSAICTVSINLLHCPPPSIHACPYTSPLLLPFLASSCSIASSSSCFPKDSLSIFFRLPSRIISDNPRPDFTDKKFLIRLEILKQSLLLQDPEHHHLNRLANQRDTERMLGNSAQHRFLKLRARGGSLQDSQTKQDNKTM